MADTNILYDEQGHPRHFNIIEDADTDIAPSATRAMPASAQEAAKQFLASHADLLQLKRNVMQSMDVRASLAPVAEDEALRFESEKHTMDSTVVSYNQTMFGLPIYQAGVSVVMHGPQNQVKAATSTLHYDVAAQPPGHSTANMGALDTAASGAHDNVVRRAIPAAQGMRINRTRLMVYQYDPADRVHHEHGDPGFGAVPPSLSLPPVPASIKPGTHYIVVDALFSYALPNWGTLNWRAFMPWSTHSWSNGTTADTKGARHATSVQSSATTGARSRTVSSVARRPARRWKRSPRAHRACSPGCSPRWWREMSPSSRTATSSAS